MPCLAHAPDVRSRELPAVYGTYVGRELFDDDLYRQSNTSLRERTRLSEFLRTFEERLVQDQQIRQLRGLQKGWDSYDAEPPNDTAFALIDRVLGAAQEQRIVITRIVPSAEGGIGACFVAGSRYAHIEASNDGELTLVMFSGNDPAQVSEIQDDQPALVEALNRIRQHSNI